jgi:hypothetical protein
MADEPSVRRRKPEPKSTESPSPEPVESESEEPKQKTPKKPKRKSPQDRLDDDEAYSTGALCLDLFRVLTFIILAWIGLSYLISNGESYSWGISNPPKYLKLEWWKKQFVRRLPSPNTPSQHPPFPNLN